MNEKKCYITKIKSKTNDFIDDFYNIYDFNKYNNNDFIIDIDIIAKWLNSPNGYKTKYIRL